MRQLPVYRTPADDRDFPLSPGDRRFIRRVALACAAGAVVLPGMLLFGPHTSDRVEAIVLAVLGFGVSAYYLRIAAGWTRADPDGLRTSRRWRGRFIPMADIVAVTTKRYQGRGGGVTVVKVRVRRGRTYMLPAPRLLANDDETFGQDVERLRRLVGLDPRPGHGPGHGSGRHPRRRSRRR